MGATSERAASGRALTVAHAPHACSRSPWQARHALAERADLDHSAGRMPSSHAVRRASLLAGIALAVSACSAVERSSTAAATPALAAPPLIVATSGDYPPFSFHADDGSLTGFDVEVARAYAQARGREVRFVEFRWPDLGSRLAAGDFDVAMSGVTVRPERLVVGSFSPVVARTSAVLVVRRGLTRQSADRRGRRIAVNHGGHLEQIARAALTKATIVPVDDNRKLAGLLLRGEVDGVVADPLELRTAGINVARPVVTAGVLSRDRKAYWVGPERQQLADDLRDWLLASEENGSLAALRLRYGTELTLGSTLAPRSGWVLELVARRLALMPAVARAKRAAGRPIEDLAREGAVLERAQADARRVGVDPQAYAALAKTQIRAAKAVQQATADGSSPELAIDRDLRPAIDRLDADLLAALVRAAPITEPADALAGELRADVEGVPGLDGETLCAIVEAIRAFPAPSTRSASTALTPTRVSSRAAVLGRSGAWPSSGVREWSSPDPSAARS